MTRICSDILEIENNGKVTYVSPSNVYYLNFLSFNKSFDDVKNQSFLKIITIQISRVNKIDESLQNVLLHPTVKRNNLYPNRDLMSAFLKGFLHHKNGKSNYTIG